MNDDRQAVLAVNDAFYRAFEKKDLPTMEKVWFQGTASLCVHPGRDVLRGWDAIRQSWEQIFKHTDYVEINIDLVTTQISGDLAYVVLVENLLQIASQHRVEDKLIATNVFERLGNHWYLVHRHGSPVVQ